MPRSVFLQLLRDEPALVEGLLKTLAGLVRQGNRRHADVVGLDVPGRLAKWLLTRAGDPTGSAIRPETAIELRRSQGELAAELGTTRSTLNRRPAELRRPRLPDGRGERVILHNPAQLAAYAT